MIADFLEDFLDPAISDWRGDKTNLLKAIVAISQIDILAEHVFNSLRAQSGASNAGEYRNMLTTREPFIQYARDVHDTHKHGQLSRRNALIRHGRPPQQDYVGGVFSGAVFDSNVFNVGELAVVILLDSGQQVQAADIIEGCYTFWMNELQRLGLA